MFSKSNHLRGGLSVLRCRIGALSVLSVSAMPGAGGGSVDAQPHSIAIKASDKIPQERDD